MGFKGEPKLVPLHIYSIFFWPTYLLNIYHIILYTSHISYPYPFQISHSHVGSPSHPQSLIHCSQSTLSLSLSLNACNIQISLPSLITRIAQITAEIAIWKVAAEAKASHDPQVDRLAKASQISLPSPSLPAFGKRQK